MRKTAVFAMALAAGVLLLPAHAAAEVTTEAIAYEHNGTELEGYFAYDASIEGPRPGVLIVHEWWGLGDHAKHVARELAKLGYAAFALDMYGKGVLTDDPEEASELAGQFYADRDLMRARAAAGLEILKNRPECDASKTAAAGYCFGGTGVLELARSGADLRGVAAFHGGLETPKPAEEGVVKARVIAYHGAQDPLTPPSQAMSLLDEMRKAGADCDVVLYGGAEHSFTNPAADGFGIDGVSYDEDADRRSWRAFQTFLKECFDG
jgi:dienelactone hydrolase